MDTRFGSAIVTTQPLSPILGSEEPIWPDQDLRPYFPPATIVTRSRTGEPVSRYGDDKWDFRAQSKDGSTAQTLNLWRAPRDAADRALLGRIYEQHKALLWVIADRGDTKTFSTLNRYASVARNLCTIAYEKGLDLFTLLTDFEQVGAICDEMNVNELAATKGMVQALWRHRTELLASGAQMQRDKIIEKIKAARAELPEQKQTPLIPSRIYCSVLAGLLGGLDTIERDLGVLLEALHNSQAATTAIKTNHPQATREQIKLRRGCALAETAEQMRRLGWAKGPGKSLHTFILGKVSAFQTHLMHTVVAFSGMRFGEAMLLPLNGVLATFKQGGQPHYLIKGYTHKLHRGDKVATEWVTIDQGHRAIELAMRIGKTILSMHRGKRQNGQEALLFPCILNPFKMMPIRAFQNGQTRLINSICPEITAEDLDELNRLELERGWSRNGIELGRRWPLAMHQLRRSLSVYAHRSGMVSLPALKAQLQHITDEMRAYYADGWSRAVNLVFDKDHFSHEWNAAKTESTYFGLTGALRIAFDDGDDLLGHGAQRLEQIVSGRSREQTLALIKSGTIAYRETVLGGCVSTEECKTMPLSPINFECVESNCVNLVVRSKRLDLVIRSQESVVAQLERDEKGSVAQRLEAEHLKRMLLARDRLKQAKAGKETAA